MADSTVKSKEEEQLGQRLQPEGASASGDNCGSAQQPATQSLDDLLGILKQQISSSDWLEQNTAEKWAAENPQLAKEYKEASKKT